MFYEIFVELCRRKGVSPSFVVQEIGLSKPNAVYWKRGSIPKGDTLQKLADYFGVSVDYLLGKEKVRQINFDITPDPEWMELETKLKNGTITQEEFQRYKELLSLSYEKAHKAREEIKSRLLRMIEQLNDMGQCKAVERLEELTEIPRYRAETAPESTPPPSECPSTTPAPDAPETAPEGE